LDKVCCLNLLPKLNHLGILNFQSENSIPNVATCFFGVSPNAFQSMDTLATLLTHLPCFAQAFGCEAKVSHDIVILFHVSNPSML
jgi:hypothetical protein